MKVRYSFPRYRGTLVYPEAKERAIQDGLNPDTIKCLDWYISGETIKIELTDDEEFTSSYLYVPGYGLIEKSRLGEWAARRNITIEDDGSLTWPISPAVELGRKGGLSTSEAKVSASRANGKLGGRPKKQIVILD